MRLTSDDAEIHYEVLGDGPAVVLLHPFPAHHGIWLPVADLLRSRYRVILPDLRGHGESSAGSGKATMARHADDLARLCDAAGVQRAVFGGSSIGGYILFEFWRRHRERVAALVLVGTRAGADSDEARATRLQSARDVEKDGPVQFLDSMVTKLVGQTTRTNRPDIAAVARKMMSRMTVQGIVNVQEGMAERPDSTSTLPTINAPTLLLFGDEDGTSPREEAEKLRQGIAGSRLEVLRGAGHYLVFEQPEAAGRLLRNFLDSLAPW